MDPLKATTVAEFYAEGLKRVKQHEEQLIRTEYKACRKEVIEEAVQAKFKVLDKSLELENLALSGKDTTEQRKELAVEECVIKILLKLNKRRDECDPRFLEKLKSKIIKDYVPLSESVNDVFFNNVLSQNAATEQEKLNLIFSSAFKGMSQTLSVSDKMEEAEKKQEQRLEQRCVTCKKSRGKLTKELLICSVCHSVRYCSKQCQKADWEKHKVVCKTFQQPKKAEARK